LNFDVQVRRAAELDIAEAQVWYERQRSGLGADFYSEISRIFTILRETPLIYPIMYHDVRRALVHRFPYLLWYRVVDTNVTVLACTHARQSPGRVK
jgi:plasmid stabilization system protein ParE